ncbi:MAG: IS1182 family transposase [Nitrospiraceae bacterium]
MSLQFKPYNPNDRFLLPPALQDWLPKDHMAHFVCEAIDQLDLSLVYACYSSDRGQPAYNPTMMMRLLVYAYCIGVKSSRKIEQKTHEDVAIRILAGNQHPDHDTIAEFRKRHLKAFENIFVQVLQLCEEAGMVQMGEVSLDGTKVKANASKHKAMSYERMEKREKELRQEVRRLLQQAEQTDQTEDRKYGKGNKGWTLPEELAIREKRLIRIQEAKKALEEAARQAAQEKREQRKEVERKAEEEGRALGGRPPKISARPDPKAQRNFTDPESRIMKGADGYVQAYNCQAVVDGASQVIVACEVTDCAVDATQVERMIEQIQRNMDRLPKRASMDAGYFSKENVEFLARQSIDAYIATGRQKHSQKAPDPPRGRIPAGATVKDRMSRKLRTKKGQEVYARRKTIAEPPFGQIKNRGFRQFSLRGLTNAKAEWKLVCTTHNLLKLFRSGRRPWAN